MFARVTRPSGQSSWELCTDTFVKTGCLTEQGRCTTSHGATGGTRLTVVSTLCFRMTCVFRAHPRLLSQIRSRFGGMKSYWSPPEAIGAAAVLESLTGDPSFQVDRRRLWTYCREQMIDEERGGWHKIPAAHRRDNTDPKGDLFDPDYHALGACFETLQSLASDRLRENGIPRDVSTDHGARR